MIVGQSLVNPGSAHRDLALAVGGPVLRSGTSGWGPVVPTEMRIC